MKPSMALKPLVFAIAALMAVAVQAEQGDRRGHGNGHNHTPPPTKILVSATATANDRQSSTNNRILNEGTQNSAEMSSSASGASGNVGVNVAADPLFTVSYTGTNGALVIITADDPSLHSSQNEQDTRFYGQFAQVPVLEPSDAQEALEFTRLAFELSERFDTPVIVRTTTRLSHTRSTRRGAMASSPRTMSKW